MPTNKDLLPDVNVVLTGAPFGMYLTVTVQDIMQAELGVPVRGLIPADPAQHAPALATVARWLVTPRRVEAAEEAEDPGDRLGRKEAAAQVLQGIPAA